MTSLESTGHVMARNKDRKVPPEDSLKHPDEDLVSPRQSCLMSPIVPSVGGRARRRRVLLARQAHRLRSAARPDDTSIEKPVLLVPPRHPGVVQDRKIRSVIAGLETP